jgi:transcription elongation factor Elf1
MAKELKKSCPFCNSPASNLYLTKTWVDGDEYTEIFCNRCKIYFRLEDSVGDTKVNEKQLIDFWNEERGTDNETHNN